MAASAKIIDLRNLLAERFPHPSCTTAKRLNTGLPFLEESIGGGLPRGAITELISPGTSAGSASLIHALVHCAYRDNYFLALIDGRDSFDPCGLDNAWLQHLLWVRCSKASEAVKAADLLLRDGNFPLVIVDLVLNAPEELRKIPQTNWYRLQRLVEVLPTACLVLTRYEMVSSAQLKLVLENSWDIQTFESEDALSRLRIVVKRSHVQIELRISSQRSTRHDVRHDLFAEFLFAGSHAASAGTLRKTSSVDRRTRKETGHHSTERSRRKRRYSKRNDPEPGVGAIIAGGHQSSCTHAGKIDTGNFASLRVYSQSFCGRHCAGCLHSSVYELPQFE